MDLEHQLQTLGIQPTNKTFFTKTAQYDTNGLRSPIPQEIKFMNAELRRCEVENCGVTICLFSGAGNFYEFVRTLRKCIYGKVKHAVQLRMTSRGTLARTNTEVAIKIMSKVTSLLSYEQRRESAAL